MTDVKNPNKYRLLRVFEYMQKTDEAHPLNVTQLIEKLQEDGGLEKTPDRKSILRDLQCIEDCGYELVWGKNHNVGKYMSGKEKPLAGYQLKMLADAVASARFLAAEDARKLVNKIMELGSTSDKELLKKVVIRDESLNVAIKQAKYYFNEVLEAIRLKKQLSFQYNYKFLPKPAPEDLAREGHIYYVSPYYLVPANNDYYVIGCTGEHDNFSHYRLSRMLKVKMEEKLAARPLIESSTYKKLLDEGKNIGDYLREHVNMWFGDTQRVSLLCKQYCRLDVLGKFGNNINLVECSDDREAFTTSVNVRADGGFFGWVAGFGGDVVIKGPESVREEYKKYLQKQLKAYT